MRKFVGERTFTEADDLLDQIEQVIKVVTKEITAKIREDLFVIKTRFHHLNRPCKPISLPSGGVCTF